MKTKYLILIAIIVAFSSCSAAYQTGQTPDDVYYSPAPATDNEYVVLDNPDEREIRNQMQSLRYRNNLSLSIGYGYNPYYSPGYGFGYSQFGYPYSYGIYDPFGWYYFSNPYPFYNPFNRNLFYDEKSGYYNGGYSGYPYEFYRYTAMPKNTGPRQYNLGVYNNNAPRTPISGTYRGSDGRTYTPTQVPIRKFTPPQSAPPKATGVGGFIRKVFTPSTERRPSNSTPNRTFERNNQRENNPTPPTRTFTPTPPSPSSSNSGSAPVRTFRKD